MTGGRVGLVVALVVLAGCGGLAPEAGDGPGPRGTAASLPEDTTRVSVTAVVDGDTIRVEYRNGTRDTVRLVGVDTPEVHAESAPAEFEGVPETSDGVQCLRTWGDRASAFTRDHLAGEQVRVSFDANEGRRGGYGRLLVYVHHDGRLFNHRLVEEGYARVYDSEFTKRERFYATEERVQSQGVGLWSCRDGGTASDSG